jgi:tetratricopeptide (TPR) repeat protein
MILPQKSDNLVILIPTQCYNAAMRREDYILRLIAEFVQALHRITGLSRAGQQQAALGAIDHALRQTLGDGLERTLAMTTPELVARLAFAESDEAGRDRCAYAVALLKEAGGAFSALGHADDADTCFARALALLLATLRRNEPEHMPPFTPTPGALVAALGLYRLPADLYAPLVAHYEQAGAFADAEDALFAWLETSPHDPAALDFGVALFRRLAEQNDAILLAGDLSRREVEETLAELMGRRVKG